MSMAIVGASAAALSAGVGIYKTIHNANKEKKANKALDKLEANRPQYQVNPITRNMAAGSGFGSESDNYYSENVNRGLGAGINAITTSGGDINQIMQLINGANSSYKQYSMASAQQKRANQMALVDEQKTAWNQNVNVPYLQQYYRNVQRGNTAAINASNGADQAISALSMIPTSGYGGSGGRMESGAGQVGQGGYGLQNYGSQYQMNMQPIYPQYSGNQYSPNFNTNWNLGG